MNIQEIEQYLREYAGAGLSVDPHFHFDRYRDNPRHDGEISLVTNPRYLPPLASLIGRLRPQNILTIGALYGTLESYLLQCLSGRSWLATITVIDLDIPDYNVNRDNGSLIYRNICGTQYGAFHRTFTHIRGSSMWPDVMKKVRACGPFDLVFIDGEHTREAVYSDLMLSSDCLAADGTILVHDTSLHSSSVPEGWANWTREMSPRWVSGTVPDDVFLLGLGFTQRARLQ